MSGKAPGKVGFISLGCPKALVDSERILTQLRTEGYEVTPTYDDADVVVVYVLGGVTPSEIREVREAIKAAEAQHARAGGTSGSDKPPPRIVVGGTRLIMPHALMAQLWQA